MLGDRISHAIVPILTAWASLVRRTFRDFVHFWFTSLHAFHMKQPIIYYVFETRTFYLIFLVLSVVCSFTSCLQSWYTLTVTEELFQTSTTYAWFFNSVQIRTYTSSQLVSSSTVPNDSHPVRAALLASFSLAVAACAMSVLAGCFGAVWLLSRAFGETNSRHLRQSNHEVNNNDNQMDAPFTFSISPMLQTALQYLWPLMHMLSVLVAVTALVQLIFSLPVAFATNASPLQSACANKPSICSSFTNSFATIELNQYWGPNVGFYLEIGGSLFQIAAIILTFSLIVNDKRAHMRSRIDTGYVSLLAEDQDDGFTTTDEYDSRRVLSTSDMRDFSS